jgi:hypothetical protein
MFMNQSKRTDLTFKCQLSIVSAFVFRLAYMKEMCQDEKSCFSSVENYPAALTGRDLALDVKAASRQTHLRA